MSSYRDKDRDDSRSSRHQHHRDRSLSPARNDRDRHSSSRRDDRDRDHGKDRDRRRDEDGDRRDSKRSRHGDDDDRRRDRDRDRERGRDKEHKSSSTKPKKVRETSAERAIRKAEKKAEKAANAALLLPAEARLAAAEVSMYSSTDNPFHDANLADRFVWGKKQEKERKSGMTPEEARRKDALRAIESQQEIERLNQRRAEREAESALREEEAMRAARAAESAQMSAWIDREDDFHLEQAKKRAQIRVKERRAKPIDFLALNLKWSQPPLEPGDEGYDEYEEDDGVGLEVDTEEPYTIFDNLTLEDSEELHEDIKMYLSLEKTEANLEFWRALLIVSSASLEALRDERAIGTIQYAAQTATRAKIKEEHTRLLSNKTHDQLVALQSQIQRKLTSGEPIDVEYWEGLLKDLVVWKAKGKLRDMHEVVLSNRLEQLRRKQRDEAVKFKDEVKSALHGSGAGAARADEGMAEAYEGADDDEMDLEGGARVIMAEPWDESMEPKKLSRIPEDMRSCEIVDPEQELQALYTQRRTVAHTRFVPKQATLTATEEPDAIAAGKSRSARERDDEIWKAAIGQGLDHEEELFSLEASLGKTAYTWEDKYRPRKPRYFNKVHTGYEWNKYNQTHYDSDNPPPKVVQGYKFSIFYPDLIDKSKAPQYKVIKEKGNDDTCTLIFTAGPPYEDLAFTIVNKQWEYSHKRGFRSSFDRGVLQLHVQFQRNFYRK